MRLVPIGGLCNRLRAIFSHLEWCRTMGGGEVLYVYWIPHVACPAAFGDLFDMEGLEEAGLVIREGVMPTKGQQFIQTCSVHQGAVESVWGSLAARLLRPIPVIRTRIDGLLASLGDDGFTALHIRRTDHNSNYDQDAVFVEYAGAQGSVYAATDNPRSMVTLKKALGSRLHYNGRFAQTGIRLTDVADAVVDLWVCAAAARFRGTYYSSFSDWIEMMRSLHGATPGDLTKIT
jgi:hypothetical protein